MKSQQLPVSRKQRSGVGRTLIDEAIAEAKLTEQLGFDAVWLAEHHFDGICAYVDPISFAAGLATATSRIKIGFAVAQLSLHHPIRLAEQISLLDNITKGRIIAGRDVGRHTTSMTIRATVFLPSRRRNAFEECGSDHAEGTVREPVEHHGKYWDLSCQCCGRVPAIRVRTPSSFGAPAPRVLC